MAMRLTSLSGKEEQLPELRIVLMGCVGAGKSSTGNTILGKKAFDLKSATKCVKRQGVVAERRVTVVDTPGRWSQLPLIDTTNIDKQEIMCSVLHCEPGPHAVLLVIRADKSFNKTLRIAVMEHMELLGKEVWTHTILVFSHGDSLIDTNIIWFIERGGEDLEWLVEKCGDRFHVLNNESRDNQAQVTELLERIEKLVEENNSSHYGIDKNILRMKEWRATEEVKAKERMKIVQKQRQTLRSKIADTGHFPEMRILLMGYQYSGKSSTGNTILGQDTFPLKRTTQCLKHEGNVQGRLVTVVDTPGRWRLHPIQFTPELFKQEIVLSASFCPPGPHAILLLIRLDTSFTHKNREPLEQHLGLLGEHVWSRTIAVFTCGDWLGDTSIEQFIESEGEALQWVIEKCGNRYHVLNNKNKDDDAQVTELLEKIEEMVAGNNGRHYEIERNILQKKQNQHKSYSHHLSKLRIVLLGYRRAGKSCTGNTVLGSEMFDTSNIAQCVAEQREVAGRQVTVVDTPGWDWGQYVEDNTELDWNIVNSKKFCSPGPHGLLLVIRLSFSFKEANRRAAQKYLELLGKYVWSHTIVVFTHGDWLGDTSVEQFIESEGEALQWVIEKCGNRYHVLNNKNKDDDSQVTELLDKIEQMVASNGGRHYEMDKDIFKKVERRMILKSYPQKSMKKTTSFNFDHPFTSSGLECTSPVSSVVTALLREGTNNRDSKVSSSHIEIELQMKESEILPEEKEN
ncbi:GTPase IMAP family member 8-like [Chanos chanos]|uniref:GTPase IMAP family member 8-like n=1 Tax=Chanos chanos TaxID=29144 RepID=A0A6J2VDD2_CHACN|nr:GTPase IMAP family member 8-like [Chanos chanos]